MKPWRTSRTHHERAASDRRTAAPDVPPETRPRLSAQGTRPRRRSVRRNGPPPGTQVASESPSPAAATAHPVDRLADVDLDGRRDASCLFRLSVFPALNL